MKAHTHSSTITIEADPALVWKVIADEFTEVSAWGPGVNSSGPNPATPNGLNGSRHGGRVCDVEGLGETAEEIVAYDDDGRSLSYTVEAVGLPPFIKRLQNTWTVSAAEPDNSDVATELAITFDDSLSADDAKNIADAMFAGVGGASTNLKQYIEASRS